ncbi:DUF2218 domain-containing protein [Maritalea porphyrae]|uniref:DUF2218 domain-containing protein n=1 Tax=Maritalea porphyrae TaxID=880732 RepID=UPI0022B021E3|nr:DUF2218 domain-containing protein [Maritalea porphyrae]MCZ4271069.1 DUF2218 domain-containing protein [Maritalea porphyrae]
MKRSTAIFKTEKGERYLGQLVKHFAHKIDAAYEGDKGYIKFEFGTVNLNADHQGLNMLIDALDQEALDRTKKVTENHLVRFAFREELESLDWEDFSFNA